MAHSREHQSSQQIRSQRQGMETHEKRILSFKRVSIFVRFYPHFARSRIISESWSLSKKKAAVKRKLRINDIETISNELSFQFKTTAIKAFFLICLPAGGGLPEPSFGITSEAHWIHGTPTSSAGGGLLIWWRGDRWKTSSYICVSCHLQLN